MAYKILGQIDEYSLMCSHCLNTRAFSDEEFKRLDGQDGQIKCSFCKTLHQVRYENNSTEHDEKLQEAQKVLDDMEFVRAYDCYSYILGCNDVSDKIRAKAHFGMALADYGISNVVIKNGRHEKKYHIINDMPECEFSQCDNYKKALDLADDYTREDFIKRAKYIDNVYREINEIKRRNIQYDVFIAVKVSNLRGGGYTEDSEEAKAIYDKLKSAGYNPFYSGKIMEGKEGVSYEAEIYYALMSAKSMLVVAFNKKHLDAPWVRSECKRYYAMMRSGKKENDSLAIVEKKIDGRSHMSIEDLPKTQNFKVGGSYLDKVVEFVKKHKKNDSKLKESILKDEAVVNEVKQYEPSVNKQLGNKIKSIDYKQLCKGNVVVFDATFSTLTINCKGKKVEFSKTKTLNIGKLNQISKVIVVCKKLIINTDEDIFKDLTRLTNIVLDIDKITIIKKSNYSFGYGRLGQGQKKQIVAKKAIIDTINNCIASPSDFSFIIT